jgi:DNA repair exonuclease SbcCD nuclease subunit
MKIKFAHISDVHLGAWRNENLNVLGNKAFDLAIERVIKEKVDFVIISGDLFDISNPNVDVVDHTIKKLKDLYDNEIPVYGIMGSHDFSPSEKSMIRPLISAGFFINVSRGKKEEKLYLKFVKDTKTNIKLTGLRARKRSLEIEDYHNLDTESLEKENGLKIFVLHTMLHELKPLEFKDMESTPKSVLPKGFIYYAAGHLHKVVPESLKKNNKILITKENNIVYPGCIFPTDFIELEKFHYGGFCLISGELEESSNKISLEAEYISLKVKEVKGLVLDCNNKSVQEVLNTLDLLIFETDFTDKIVTLRMLGTLSSGKSFEIKTNEIREKIKTKGAYEVLINKTALKTKEYSPVRVVVGKTNQEIENTLIHEHSQKSQVKGISKEKLEPKIHTLLTALGNERVEGTKVGEYKDELIESFIKIFDLVKEE